MEKQTKMMHKNHKILMIVIAIIIILGLGGGALAYKNNQDNKKEAEKMAMEKSKADEAMKMEESMKAEDAIKKDEAMKSEDAMKKDDGAMMSKGVYKDYTEADLANAEKGHVVLFFNASWCPTCQAAVKNFKASSVPDGLTLLSIDYDKYADLKKKYGVTYQHTFVQVDKNGNQIKKWSGSTSFSEIEAQIK